MLLKVLSGASVWIVGVSRPCLYPLVKYNIEKDWYIVCRRLRVGFGAAVWLYRILKRMCCLHALPTPLGVV